MREPQPLRERTSTLAGLTAAKQHTRRFHRMIVHSLKTDIISSRPELLLQGSCKSFALEGILARRSDLLPEASLSKAPALLSLFLLLLSPYT